jgi:dolichol-phosphate mannosyltransferase
MGERVLVSLATYNERDNLLPLVSEIHAHLPEADILVIDDNSPDGTGELADTLARANPRVHVVHRPGKQGLGTATVAAMRYAIAHEYTFLINMDADFSHHPRYLPALRERARDYDVVIGSRYIPGGGVQGWPWTRAIMSWGVNALSRVLFRLPVRDTSGAYRVYRVSLLRRLPLGQLWSKGYSFQEEVLYLCRRAGGRFAEVPIVFENRREGTSKVNLREAVRSLAILGLLGVAALLGLEGTPLRRSTPGSL